MGISAKVRLVPQLTADTADKQLFSQRNEERIGRPSRSIPRLARRAGEVRLDSSTWNDTHHRPRRSEKGMSRGRSWLPLLIGSHRSRALIKRTRANSDRRHRSTRTSLTRKPVGYFTEHSFQASTVHSAHAQSNRVFLFRLSALYARPRDEHRQDR